jgi:hypothetical protein
MTQGISRSTWTISEQLLHSAITRLLVTRKPSLVVVGGAVQQVYKGISLQASSRTVSASKLA